MSSRRRPQEQIALADPLALFVPPRAARCRLAEAAAWFEAGGEGGAGFRAAYA